MSWRAVGVVYGAFVVLLAVVLATEQTRPEAPPPEAAPARSLLGVVADRVRAVTFERGAVRVRATRADGRWRVIEPAGAPVPPDLVDAAVATLTAGQVSDVVAEDARPDTLASFGLTRPTSTIVATVDAGDAAHDVTVILGDVNPTRTALYARRGDEPQVYLVGLNLRYYEDLIFSATAG